MDSDIGSLTIIFTEFYYWVTVVFMFLIHVGFCMYEVGSSRQKNHMHTLMKNTMVIPVVTFSFFLVGWWIYFALPNGPWINGPIIPSPWAEPWSELMGAHMGGAAGDPNLAAALAAEPTSTMYGATSTTYWARLNGVFWAAFLLFSWTTASIISGCIIERVRSGAFWIIAAMVGSFTWILDAAWGWHFAGWMVVKLGYHDAYASGVVHAVAGGTALAVLVVLGPRIGKFRADGSPRNIVPHNPWLVTVGLFMIYAGFWGFYAACNIPMFDVQQGDGVFFSATNIYLAPTSLSAITFNFILALSGGLASTYIISRGDAFWTYSGGLCGVIGASAGNDMYHPLQAMIIGAVIPVIAYKLHYWVERKFKIDDAVGGVAVHGYGGFLGVVAAGFVLWGMPSSPYAGYATITPWGNFIGAVIMFVVLGFVPGYILSKILNAFGLLRIPREIELVGLDLSEYAARYMDEDDIKKAELDEARATGLIRS
jgi:ammonia channel protein AmtB